MIKRIFFKNYKSFKEQQVLELKPMTVLIGKNSSGKSAIAKLPTLIENSLSGSFSEPLLLSNNGVELGAEFKDLITERSRIGSLYLAIEDESQKLEVVIGAGTGTKDIPKVFSWTLRNAEDVYESNESDQFKGFVLQSQFESSKIKTLKLNTEYIGPFRELPIRSYSRPNSSKIEKVGIDGGGAYPLLIQSALTTEGLLINEVSTWYQNHFQGWGVRVNEDKDPFFQIELVRNGGNLAINIKDVGQGMSQALPLVTRAFMETMDQTLIIIEQPELHLHSAVHGDIAELFLKSIERGGRQYLIETHSQNFVLRIRRLVAERVINKDDVVIYYADFDEKTGTSILKRIDILDDGKVSYWPTNVFSETLEETIAIRTAQLKNPEHADSN